MAQLIENKGLTELAKQNLARNEETRRALGRFVKLKDKDQVIFFFDAEKTQPVEFDDGWNPGKKKTSFEYTVVDPNTNTEHIISFSKRWSEQIDALLMAGEGTRRLIKIKRIGADKNTVYVIEAA